MGWRRSTVAGGTGLLTCLLSLVMGCPGAALAASGARNARPIVTTTSGPLRGGTTDGVDSFLGVPYAAPPTGARRWQPPAPAPRWSAIRDAGSYADRCPAAESTNGPRSETEDCLYLNVQRPTGYPGRKLLPVMFWIHGGGLLNGSSNQHDGAMFVRQDNIVVVTINYRLGMFGFLTHPALTQERGASGNYGLLDQQAALRWVHDNIAAFGGDPGRVTIAGESAGAYSVCAHLSAPGSRGMFTAAIIQSGVCAAGRTLADAQARDAALAADLGCPDVATAAECLRAVPVGKLVDAAPEDIQFVQDGVVLPRGPESAVRSGDFARVPVLIGANRDEGRTFVSRTDFIGFTQEQYQAYVRDEVGSDVAAEERLKRYPWPANADKFTATYLIADMNTDGALVFGVGGCANLTLTDILARQTETYGYEFDHRDGPGLEPEPAGYAWGSGHAAELAYLWPTFDNGTPISPTFDAGERQLSREMVRSWGTFVRTGRPGPVGVARWPSYRHTNSLMSLRAGGRSTLVTRDQLATQHQCDYWWPLIESWWPPAG